MIVEAEKMIIRYDSLRVVLTVTRLSCLCFLLMLLATAAVSARTLHVPSQSPTIHAALDSASAGDTVLVAPGTYELTYETKIDMPDSVTLIGEQGPEVTTIEFCMVGIGIQIYKSEGVRISGFTIRETAGCCAPGFTYGIGCWDCTDVTVENCVVESVSYGMYFEDSSAEWWKPVFRNNTVRNCGAGIGVWDVLDPGRPAFENNTITDCSLGAEIRDSSPLLQYNEITYCHHALFYDGFCGGDCSGNTIAHSLDIAVYIYADPPLAAPGFNGGLNPADANDFYDNASYDIWYEHSGGVNGVMAKLNYWGAECPDFESKFYGDVYYVGWVDSTHTRIITPGDCPGAAEPTTWGLIKAMFR